MSPVLFSCISLFTLILGQMHRCSNIDVDLLLSEFFCMLCIFFAFISAFFLKKKSEIAVGILLS